MGTEQLDTDTLGHVAEYLIAARRAEAVLLNEIHAWVKNRVISIYVPDDAKREYRELAELSRWNILPFLINSLANEFFIDGYRPARKKKNAKVWDEVWQRNRMDARQAGLWRPTLEFGTGYALVLPGQIGGKKTAVMTPFSPRRLTALYADPINDQWAQYVMTVGFQRPEFTPKGTRMVTTVAIYDDNWKYEIDVPAAMVATKPYVPTAIGYLETPIVVDAKRARPSRHGLGVCPAVRFLESFGEIDDGPEGVVYPMINTQRQINQTTFSTNIAEYFGAFKQKWVTGLEIQVDENGNPVQPFNAAADKVFQAESDLTKFGEFGQTDLDGYLMSRDKQLLYVSSVRQIPPHKLVVGNAVSNVSAEAIAMLNDGHGQDVAAHRTAFGESAEQMLRLAGLAMGDSAAWEDMSAQVRWRDTTPRSLNQVADSLGKLAQMLGVPPRALWERIPDVTDQDLERWEQMAKEDDTFGKLTELERRMAADARPGSEPPDADTPPAARGGSRGNNQTG